MQTDGYQFFTLQLGSQIQEIRNERGLLQEDVAAMLGMTRVAIGYIEQGRRSPKLSTLYDLANLYEVDIRSFFDFLDEPAPLPDPTPTPKPERSFRASRRSKKAKA